MIAHDPQLRDCDYCGGQHRFMEPCPEAPGFMDLLRNWGEGERGPMEWIAFSAVLVLVFFATVIVVAAI